MCIGLPMLVCALEPGHAQVAGRGETRRVNTALLPPLDVGEWVLVFLDGARERLSPERAQEINAVLDLVADAMQGHIPSAEAPAFNLPSAMSAEQLAQLSGAAR